MSIGDSPESLSQAMLVGCNVSRRIGRNLPPFGGARRREQLSNILLLLLLLLLLSINYYLSMLCMSMIIYPCYACYACYARMVNTCYASTWWNSQARKL